MKVRLKTPLKFALWSFLGITLIAVLCVGLIQTEFFQNFLIKQVNQRIPGAIEFKKFHLSPLQGSLDAENITLLNSQGEVLTEFDKLTVHVSIEGLWDKNLVIKKFQLTGFKASLVSNTQNRLNILQAVLGDEYQIMEKPKDTTTSDTSWNIILNQGLIGIESFQFEDQKNQITSGLQDLKLQVSGNLKKRLGNVNLTLKSGYYSDTSTTWPLQDFSFSSKLDGSMLDTLELKLNSGSSRVHMKGQVSEIWESAKFDVRGGFTLNLDELGARLKTPNLTGRVKGDLQASGTPDDPDFDLNLVYPGGNVFGYQIDSAGLDIHLKSLQVSLPHVFILTKGGALKWNAEADLSDVYTKGLLKSQPDFSKLTYRVNLQTKKFNFRKIIKGANIPAGLANIELDVKGKGIDVKTLENSTHLDLQVNRFSVDTAVAPVNIAAKIHAKMQKGDLKIAHLSLSTGPTHLTAKGTTNLTRESIDMNIKLVSKDLKSSLEPLGLKDIEGTLKGSVHLQGLLKAPSTKLHFQSTDLSFNKTNLGNLLLSGSTSNDGKLQIDTLHLKNKSSHLDISGVAHLFIPKTLKPKKEPDLYVHIHSSTIHLEDFVDSLQGRFTLQGEVQGNPQNLKGQIEINGKNIRTPFQNLHSLNANLILSKDTISFVKFNLAVTPKDVINLSGYIRTTQDYDLHINSKNFSITSLHALKDQEISQGTLSFDLGGQGHFKNPTVSGGIVLSKVTKDEITLPPLELKIDLADSLVHILGEGLLQWDTKVNLRTNHVKGSATLPSLELEPFLTLAGMEGFSGNIEGNLKFNGSLEKPLNSEATLNIKKLHLNKDSLSLIQTKNLLVHYSTGHLQIPKNTITLLSKGHLHLKGEAEITGESKLEMQARVPLKVLSPFAPDLQGLKGHMDVSGSIKGNLNDPKINIKVTLNKAGLDIPGIEQSLSQINGTLTIDESSLKIQKIQGNIENGKLNLDGNITLNKWKPINYDVSLRAHNTPLSIPGVMDILVNNKLHLTGDTLALKAVGELTLREATYYQNINLAKILSSNKTREIEATSVDTGQTFLDRLQLELEVTSEAPFTVDNNIAFMEINPDIQIRGPASGPVVSGRGTVKSGRIKWKRREFYITKGVVDFLNPYKTEATIDIQSEMKIQNWLVGLNISGTAPDKLLLKLEEKTAKPPLEDADILSILVTGKTTAQLMGKSENGQISKTQMLQSLIASTGSRLLEDKTALDRVEIEAGEGEGSGESSDIKVTLGKNISRRLSTAYSIEAGEEGGVVQRGTAEYKLLENILLKGFQDTEGVYGGGVEWNIKWR